MPAFTRLDLENKIKEIYGIDEISPVINNQITKYVQEKGYTFLDIARALVYHYIINDGDLRKSFGSIGIVPYVMKDAKAYFAREAARVQAQLEQVEKIKNEGRNYDIICKKKIKKIERKKPFIDLSSIKEED